FPEAALWPTGTRTNSKCRVSSLCEMGRGLAGRRKAVALSREAPVARQGGARQLNLRATPDRHAHMIEPPEIHRMSMVHVYGRNHRTSGRALSGTDQEFRSRV